MIRLLVRNIKRRAFLKYFCNLGMSCIVLPMAGFPSVFEIVNRIKARFRAPVKLPPDSERQVVELPPEGKKISVETALNSRCTSDYDDNPELFHWGMFDKAQRLSSEQISTVADLATIPRFTSLRAEIKIERNILTFIADNHATGIQRDWLMVESGMQQQAVCLLCSALGIGMVFKSLGADGVPISDTDYAAITIRLDAMKPTYDGFFWSSLPPAGRRPWRKGNLPDPVRNGKKPLIAILRELETDNKRGIKLTDQSMSQLLWAARGRTPHLYKSRPWGMTIPTAGGRQNISAVYLICGSTLYRYSNWQGNRPTHSLEALSGISADLQGELRRLFRSANCFIVIGKNETFARALWEVGYQLLNILLQAKALDIAYEVRLFDESQRKIFGTAGIDHPAGAVALARE